MMVMTTATISAYDCYVSIKYQDSLRESELNPMGNFLIDLDGGSVALFMAAKLLGTSIAVGLLLLIYFWRRTCAIISATVLTLFQLFLFWFLNWG